MAKQKQAVVKRYRYYIRCKKCENKYHSDTLDQCECGSTHLFADDNDKITSRTYIDGVEIR